MQIGTQPCRQTPSKSSRVFVKRKTRSGQASCPRQHVRLVARAPHLRQLAWACTRMVQLLPLWELSPSRYKRWSPFLCVNLARRQYYELRCLHVSRCPTYTQFRSRFLLRMQRTLNTTTKKIQELCSIRHLPILSSRHLTKYFSFRKPIEILVSQPEQSIKLLHRRTNRVQAQAPEESWR